jgi:hypothetical protein
MSAHADEGTWLESWSAYATRACPGRAAAPAARQAPPRHQPRRPARSREPRRAPRQTVMTPQQTLCSAVISCSSEGASQEQSRSARARERERERERERALHAYSENVLIPFCRAQLHFHRPIHTELRRELSSAPYIRPHTHAFAPRLRTNWPKRLKP